MLSLDIIDFAPIDRTELYIQTNNQLDTWYKWLRDKCGWYFTIMALPKSYTEEDARNNYGCWRFDVSLPTQNFTELFNRWRRTDVKDEIEILREFSYDDGRSSLTDLSFIVRNYTLYLSLCGEFKQKGYHFNSRRITKDGSTHYKQILSESKEDAKMSKVKMQPPTYYSSFRKFTKVIRSGPVTVAWIEGKKFMVRKTKKDKDDTEKAMLMLFAKSQFSSEAAFHRWFRDQMKMFKEAENNAKN